ncbi:MAG: TPR repeat-containing protein [Ignavibacteria bacterium]|nr:MAG: TPR repeat-containing protein [Ignavibacteria bacterium]KAF0161552.1 MAG: TPR repeat-containing protein [Ignavibacteria bacterium]
MKKYFFILFLCFVLTAQAQNNPNVDNKFRLAQSFEMAAQFDKAETLYRELAGLQSWNYTFFESINRVLILQKKYKESVELIEARIKDSPNDTGLYGMLGTTYFYSDNLQKAYETWERGIAANANSFITYRIIANSAIENRAYEKAIEYLKRGKNISNDPFPFMIDLASIYAINMNFTDAASELCELISVRPDHLATAKARVVNYITRPLAAEQTIHSVVNFVRSKETVELFDFLAFVYFQSGKFDKSLETIIKAERKFKGNGNTTIVFAQESFRNRQFETASKAYKFLIDNFPNSPHEIYAQLGYAKALEETLNEKCNTLTEKWKPFTLPKVLFPNDYEKIINAYNTFVTKYSTNASSTEALFRAAEIYRIRLHELNKADSLYNLIISNAPLTNYAIDANIACGKIALLQNNIDKAKRYYFAAESNPRIDPAKSFEAKFLSAKTSFWKGDFSTASEVLKSLLRFTSTDFSNDALELSFLINSTKRDSINLAKYAKADLLLLQNNYKQAAVELKTLGDNDNLFIINQFAKMRMAEIFISENNFFSALPLLEKLSSDEKNAIFAEKATFLLASTFLYGIGDRDKAIQTYQKLLENFPNSIYFDRVRDKLN